MSNNTNISLDSNDIARMTALFAIFLSMPVVAVIFTVLFCQAKKQKKQKKYSLNEDQPDYGSISDKHLFSPEKPLSSISCCLRFGR